MKEMSSTEFAQKVNAYKVHKELSRRTKKETESYQEYVYKMFDIAKQVNMKSSVVRKYIIDGIRDEETNRMILYGVKGIRELKEKLTLYEAIKKNAKTRGKRVEEGSKRMNRDKAARKPVRQYFLCRNKDHLSAFCPTKSKGTTCFKRQEYGYIASKCKNLSES